MKKIISILLILGLGISGCSISKKLNEGFVTEQVITTPVKDLAAETKSIADQYQDIYELANANKTLGSLDVTRDIITRLGDCGYIAVDMDNEIDMTNAEKVVNFCNEVDDKQEANMMILRVKNNGDFYRFDFHTNEGSVDIKTYYITWDGVDKKISSMQDFTAYTWKYTEYGYLIFEEYHPLGYDGESGHTAIRVQPLSETCREYNRKYIKPIGYGYNNMYTTEWNENDFQNLNFYDLYEVMYDIKNGYPCGRDLIMLEEDTYGISKKEFEGVITSFFNIDGQTLQSKTVYYEDREVYRYRPRGLYDCYMPNYPEPEVIGYNVNEDGTITLTVNAVWEWENNDTAFRHEVVVRPMDDGGVQYVSNHILQSEEYVEPTWYEERLTDEEWQEYYEEVE